MDRPVFYTKTRLPCASVFEAERSSILKEIQERLGISQAQITEAASYSMAMVVRFALGLSAQDGQVCVLAADSIAGCIGLATLRHLVNAGSRGHVIVVGKSTGQDLNRELKTLKEIGVPVSSWTSSDQSADMAMLFASCHNVIYGLYCDPGSTNISSELVATINELVNEMSTPIHCIELPLGLHPDTGVSNSSALFASSTLSLGVPLAGLHAGNELAGRHYVCDISMTQEMYKKLGQPEGPAIFSEQPVLQILFELPAEAGVAPE
jgi:NAD(P)H-hydrate repair Nnr-like enzyme with NAD(P)H-hydrate epimerase domain